MIVKSTLIALCISLFALISSAQDYAQCERDYSLLQQSVETLPEEILPGKELFLSQFYLESIESGYFKDTPSGMKHWTYVRPASRKELKDMTINENPSEKVGSDGNVYGLSITPSGVHFFRPTEVFEGDYQPKWNDPELDIPLGLMPVNVLQYNNRLFVVKESHDDFLLVEVAGNTLVFYPGYPRTEKVFDSENVLNRVAEKQNLASTLLGGEFIVNNSSNLHYRTRSGGLDHSLDSSIDEFTIKIKDVVATRREVLLAYGEEETFYLVIDKESDFILYDKICIVDAQRDRALRAQEDIPDPELELNDLVRKDLTPAELLENSGLVAALKERFHLKANHKGKKEYEHVLLNQKEEYVTGLTPELDEEGRIGLLSCYISPKGLYHTKIEIRIDEDEPIASQRISTLDSRSSRKKTNGEIVELIHFSDGSDKGIIKAIAQNADKPIMVRYTAGGSFFKDIELPQSYKDAIRDAYLFSIILSSK